VEKRVDEDGDSGIAFSDDPAVRTLPADGQDLRSIWLAIRTNECARWHRLTRRRVVASDRHVVDEAEQCGGVPGFDRLQDCVDDRIPGAIAKRIRPKRGG
jgi:hypothetical protein